MTTSDEAQIRALLRDRSEAIRDKDAERVLGAYAPAAVLYDLAPPLGVQGDREEGRARLESWFSTWASPIEYDLHGFTVDVGGDLALAHGLLRIGGLKTDGSAVEVWVRQTVGLRRAGSGWAIAHEHTSVPFLMDGSFRAAVDLVP